MVVMPTTEIKIRPMWQVEREKIEEAITACKGNIPRAAALLELSPSTIYRRLKESHGNESQDRLDI
jgi:transcriptional regulator of acetoin/glycerol metabolism